MRRFEGFLHIAFIYSAWLGLILACVAILKAPEETRTGAEVTAYLHLQQPKSP